MKNKETVEEAAAKHFNKEDIVEGVNIQYVLQCAFIDGAKWQQKQMYSEEEVKHIIEKTLIEYSDYVLADIPEWFEQFSKLKNGHSLGTI